MNEIRYTVEIADATGHTVAQMSKPEIVDKVQSSKGTWVFVNNQLVSANDLNGMEIAQDATVRLMPGLVGGNC